MRLWIILIVFCMPLQSSASDSFLAQIRNLYVLATQQEKSCEELIKTLEPYDENNNPLYAGYKAAATMLMAKYAFNPFSKLSYFKKGKNLLEKAINKDQKNMELRFIRYAIQLKTPGFLNYKAEINNDKTFLIENFKGINDTQLKNNILQFLKNETTLNNKDKIQLGL